MTVYVDNACIAWNGRQWCHLVADTLDELHGFAHRLGLKRTWFQDKASYPHYDVTISVRSRAFALGALPADKATLLACCRKLKEELFAMRAEDTSLLSGQPQERMHGRHRHPAAAA